MARELECPVFYSSTENKDEVLKDWKSGPLVATGALGAGVNIDDLHWVFHVGLPYGLIQFDQESGRGGRAREEVESLIFLKRTSYDKCLNTRPESLSLNERAMREFIVEQNCFRSVRSKWMNGEEEMKSCDQLNDCKRCRLCRARDSRRMESQARLRDISDSSSDEEEEIIQQASKRRRFIQRELDVDAANREIGERKFQLEKMLEELQNKCEICWTINSADWHHTRAECPQRNGRTTSLIMQTRNCMNMFKQANLALKYEKDACCYRCGRPGDQCYH